MSEICRICRKPLATDEDHTVFQLIDWEDPANGDPDDYRLDLCWSEYAGGEHLTPEGALIEDELEHVIEQRDRAEAALARMTASREAVEVTGRELVRIERIGRERAERERDEARAALESKELAVQEKTCSECQRECEIENRRLEADVARLKMTLNIQREEAEKLNRESAERFARWIASQRWCRVNDTEYWMDKLHEFQLEVAGTENHHG